MKLYQDYLDLLVGEWYQEGGVGEGANGNEYGGVREPLGDEWGDYMGANEGDSGLSDLGEGTNIGGHERCWTLRSRYTSGR